MANLSEQGQSNDPENVKQDITSQDLVQEESNQQEEKTKKVTTFYKWVCGIFIVVEWIIGISLSNYSGHSWFGGPLIEEMVNAIFAVFEMFVINALTYIIIIRLIRKIINKERKNKVAEWITTNSENIKKKLLFVLFLVEWILGLLYKTLSLSSTFLILAVNIITITLIKVLSRKINKEKVLCTLSSIKHWCGEHKGAVITLVTALIALIVLSNVDFKDIKRRKTEERIESSIASGDSQRVMTEVKKAPKYEHPLHLLTRLVETDNIDAAIYFYENKTSHCSTDEMAHKYSADAEFTRAACKLLYTALISHEQMEKAWTYHPLEYDNPNNVDNAQCYYDYMNDVVNYYCGKDDKPAALQFTKQHIIWFVKNVDNDNSDKYSDYHSEKVKSRLMEYIENY